MRGAKHDMPFGAAVVAGGTRFRLWAPDVAQVDLLLSAEGDEVALPMMPLAGGWFERVVAGVGAGQRYRFRIEGGLRVPDPASRCNPDDVDGPSVVVDPHAFDWTDADWRGRTWDKAVIYELHVGAFTPQGSFLALCDKLDYLVELGVTALELMPVAEFPGARNWGYDGVLLFAPEASYGTPEDFKTLVRAAHQRGLMVFLDVVYNHFGPDGNYLYAYAPSFFNPRHVTPWGAAIAFENPGVREFFIHNALYWLEEYRLDGLRLDAVHAIAEDARTVFLAELAQRVREGPGRERHIHLILENDANQARYLARAPEGGPRLYDAQWNDDFHHPLHVRLTGERDGYYGDYVAAPLDHLGRVLAEGYAFQGEVSAYREGQPRGEPSRHLPPTAFIAFLQSHDQIGNRAFGERLPQLAAPEALRAATTLLLLAPSVPLLFMGEEFACPTPFRYFCDFASPLAEAVRDGRREEFARFAQFAAPEAREKIPDPGDPQSFFDSKLDWAALPQPEHAEWLAFYRQLLALRQREMVPILPRLMPARWEALDGAGLRVVWPLRGGGRLTLLANLGETPLTGIDWPIGRRLVASDQAVEGQLPAWTVLWFLDSGELTP